MSRTIRAPLVTAALVLGSAASAQADQIVVVSPNAVRFEAGRADAPPAGVTFTPGSQLAVMAPPPGSSVTFTAGARIEPSESVSPANAAPVDAPARAAIEVPIVASRVAEPVRPANEPITPTALSEPAPSRATAPTVEPVVERIEPAPSARAHATRTTATAATREPPQSASCHLASPVEYVALEGNGLRGAHLAMAVHGDRVAAMVAMTRPAPARSVHEGLVFPESRLVSWRGTGAPVVTRSLGIEPDAEIAFTDGERITVVGYERLDQAARDAHREASVIVATVDATGRVITPSRAIDGSAGLHIDSSLVANGSGSAIVLGRTLNAADGSITAVRESLVAIDRDGTVSHEPVVVTDEQGDDTLSRHRVGLAASPEGLRVTWTVASGSHAGVWTRTFDGAALGAARRVHDRAAWGSDVSGDGLGALFRSGGEGGTPVSLFYRAFEGHSRAVALGAGWDPTVAMVNGWWLVAGVSLRGNDGTPVDAIVAAARAGEPLRAVAIPEAGESTLAEAVDVRMVTTTNGVALGWIEESTSASRPRRLGLARVVCP